MHLDELIPVYYSELIDDNDSLRSGLFDVVRKSCSHAGRYMPETIRTAIGKDHLHDWIVSSLEIFQENGIFVKIAAAHHGESRTLVFGPVTHLEIHGAISVKANSYPMGTDDILGIGQILDIWTEYNKGMTYYILLNDNRYIRIVVRAQKKK